MEFRKIKNETRSEMFLSKDTTDFFRGLAILTILFGHIIQFGLPNYNGALKILYNLSSAGSATFLFLSGYASAVSSVKKEKLGFSWLLKRIIRLYVTFLPVYIVSLVFVLIQKNTEAQTGIADIIYQLFSMTLPLFLNWYLKVQAGLYILFFIFSLIKPKRLRGFLTLAVSIAYVAALWHFSIDNYWFLSVLAFPIGAVIGDFREEIITFYSKLSYGRAAAFLAVAYLYWLSYNQSLGVRKTAVYTNLLFVLMIALFSFDFKVKFTPVSFFGKNSLEIYLWHLTLIGILYLSPAPQIHYKVKIAAVILLSAILGAVTNLLIRKLTENIK